MYNSNKIQTRKSMLSRDTFTAQPKWVKLDPAYRHKRNHTEACHTDILWQTTTSSEFKTKGLKYFVLILLLAHQISEKLIQLYSNVNTINYLLDTIFNPRI